MRWLRPIPQDWIPWHLLLFIALFAMGMAMRAAEELPAHPHGDTVGFANAMIDGAVSVIVVSAAISTTIVEGALIFAEKYLKHRYEVGLEEGVEKGRVEGREEGQDTERQRWVEWFARKDAAELAGEEFNEPRPSENGHANDKG